MFINNEKTLTLIITGTARGLGSQIAFYFAELGFTIIATDKHPLENADQRLGHPNIHYFKCDILEKTDVENFFYFVENKVTRIDGLINNAVIRDFKPFHEFSIKEIESSIRINLLFHIQLTNIVIKKMPCNSFGKIITISSISGIIPSIGGSIYCFTKGSLIDFNKSLSYEIRHSTRHNITLNVICPDSFMKRDGTKLPGFQNITGKTISIIEKLLSNKINGKIYFVCSGNSMVRIFLQKVKDLFTFKFSLIRR